MDETFDQDPVKKIKAANKYTILVANLTWLCFNEPGVPAHLVYTTKHLTDYMPLTFPDGHVATIGKLVQWAAEHPTSSTIKSKYIDIRCVGTTDAGLKTYTVADVL